jgi:predicted RNA-binding Zn ribbon-like protein
MVTRSEPGYTWDFCGGDLAIDFTNTVGNRGDMPDEHFNVYGDVLSWADARGVIARADMRRLSRRAEQAPADAHGALASMIALRESLYRVLAAAAVGGRPAAADLAVLNAHVDASYAHARLTPQHGGFGMTFDAPATSLVEPITGPVVRAAIDLLTGPARARVRICADRSCGWLFLDATRSGTRRWCDMKVCGNRNKVRTFRARV